MIQTWILEDGQHWPVWVWMPLVAIVFWALWVLRDPPDPKAKVFDFNPKRGAFYFLAGLAVFPLVALIDAIFGAELTFNSMLLFTLFSSVLAGLIGTFTEHTGM
ncbi:hypothetical protein [Sphingomonas sp.]|uniref:hypothetical protein n=1 Tax=Sphingomonas sp. TaxID=28214 RepID=UPI00286C68F4|nr:hypothetical protein [Sphingomonas sp.]